MASSLGTTTADDIVNSLQRMSTPFKSDSKAIGSSVKGMKDVQKVVKAEVSSPLEGMSKFFASIDKGIRTIAEKTADSLGITTLMAKIMGNDLELSKKEANLQKIKDRGVNINKAKTKDQEEKGPGMIATLKDSFQNVDLGDKLQAALLIGALYIFTQVQDTLAVVIKGIIKAFLFVRDKVFGDTENPTGNTFAALLAAVVAWKFRGLIAAVGKAALGLGRFLGVNQLLSKQYGLMRATVLTKMIPALKNAIKALPGALWNGIGKVFKGINIASKALLVGAQGALKALGGGLTKVFNGIGKVFTLMRVGVLAMYSSMVPMLGPILPIIAIVAGIAAVLYSLKSGFDTFKTSLEDGDSMFTAVIKGLGDAMLTLVTLPGTLVKKLVGFIAGLFGFDSFKEELDKFDFKAFIKNSFVNFITSFAKVIKAIAKGASAALLAIAPYGKTPEGEFSRVYNEVMSGGVATLSDGENINDELSNSKIITNNNKSLENNILTTNTMKEKTTILNNVADQKAAAAGSSANISIVKGGTSGSNNSTSNYNLTSQDVSSNHSDQTGELFSMASA
tara:strand:+ start:381 stop:2069 length:1689 start_codon:yes stop_codon:yes gene_type:complete